MITEEEALGRILESIKPLPARRVSLVQARERFAAEEIFARVALPSFDNSAMDGYAVVASACPVGASQRVVAEQPAGADRHLKIGPGEAVRVFTGAPVPEGADAVIMQEDVRREGELIFVNAAVAAGEFVRRRGSDLIEGQKILSVGDRIHSRTLALLASQGIKEIAVGGEVHATVLTTGDELVQPGEPIGPGKIYESNSVLVRALFQKYGVEVDTVEHCPDDQRLIEAALSKGLAGDVVVIVGGVSVGARDLVKPSLTSVGASTDLWRVSVKPGKPFLFGRAGRCAIFGLPGNPVSAFMTFLLFVRPAILRMTGARENDLSLPVSRASLTEGVQNRGDRPHYVRGRLEDGNFRPVGRQESHALYGLSLANALLRIPPGVAFEAGNDVPILALE